MAGALEGIRVLDLSRVLAGPFSSMILGDLGADVIKVEGPRSKDDTRFWGPPFKGNESAFYFCTNRNKRGITVDLKTIEGQNIIKKLIAESDVVIQNFKTGTLEKFGLSYEEMKSINPGIILASVTGFGATGPYKEFPGYDYIIQAMSGLMSITGDKQVGPTKVGVAITDVITSLYTTIGVLAALNERNESGEGQHIDIALLDSAVSSLINIASNYLTSGMVPGLLGNQHPNVVPYQTFACKDREMVIAVGNDRQFKKFTEVIGRPELADDELYKNNPSRLQNKDKLILIISEELKKKTSSEWQPLLQNAGIPNGPINDMKSVFEDPQVNAREMIVEMEHPTAEKIKIVGSPLKLSKTPVEIKRHPPLFGEHTNEVLEELGYTIEDIENLRNSDVI
ncbi:crotonobetainyl-CoA:carnitine CoA-transferase CaiB-like acyl-CoA transferase [Neobacillus niacini]|uniref:CaiB/BaiF CoA transferase family protein n=1 Tax=Neobacillus niacini TaxID=86668 RepID=UPI002786E23B|nr:CaiB/BaiF CoA-transferase family protein [Neobacillus niacini]MDQ1002171.1 crotonobetainyl-CoA:carnitine CoA-transferase CaiB-like acyl-CoA transferase [Neobacillus niacini]